MTTDQLIISNTQGAENIHTLPLMANPTPFSLPQFSPDHISSHTAKNM